MLAPYDVLMFYAFFNITSAWSWGRRREVPDGLLAVFGVGVPIGAWLFSQFFSWSGLLIAASYVGLWQWSSGREAAAEAGLKRLREEDRVAAVARLRQAPDDGVARLMLAQEFEKAGNWDEALRQYEAAHRLSAQMLSEASLAQARERLQRAMSDKRSARRPVGARRVDMRRRDWACAAAGVVLAIWSPARGLAALTAMMFARWLTSGDDSRAARSSF